MKTTHNTALNLHPIFVPLNQLFGTILDFEFWIAGLLYRFALSFFINLIRRRRTLNIQSSIDNIQSFIDSDNIPIQFSCHKMHMNNIQDITHHQIRRSRTRFDCRVFPDRLNRAIPGQMSIQKCLHRVFQPGSLRLQWFRRWPLNHL